MKPQRYKILEWITSKPIGCQCTVCGDGHGYIGEHPMVDVPGKDPAQTITYKCSSCRAKLESPAELGGKEDTCPICGTTCPVPMTRRQRAEDRERKAGQALGAAPTAGPNTIQAATAATPRWLLPVVGAAAAAVILTLATLLASANLRPREITGRCWATDIDGGNTVSLQGAPVGLYTQTGTGRWHLKAKTKTEQKGRFWFYNLSAGRYKISGEFNNRLWSRAHTKVERVKVPPAAMPRCMLV